MEGVVFIDLNNMLTEFSVKMKQDPNDSGFNLLMGQLDLLDNKLEKVYTQTINDLEKILRT